MNSTSSKETAQPKHSYQSSLWIVWILVAANWIAWLKYLPDSFWLDECGTMWLIDGGFADLIRRSLLLLHGPLFGAIMTTASSIGGSSELAMRLPSWIAIGISIYLFSLLSRELFEPFTATTALTFFSLWPIVSASAVDARPYSFAMVALCGSYLCFLRASRDGRFLHFSGFCLGMISLVYLQLLFIYILAIPVLYLLLAGRVSLRTWRRSWIASALTILVALTPLYAHYRVMFGWGSGYSWAPKPDFISLLLTLTPLKVFLVFAVAAIACTIWIRKIKFTLPTPHRSSLVFCLIVALFPVLLLFAISQLTGTSLFVARYLMPATPGLALLWAWLFARIEPAHICLRISMGALALSLLTHAAFHSSHQNIEDWRGALTRTNQLQKDSKGLLVLYSSFIESASIKVLRNPDQRAFLLSPLIPYPVPALDVLVLPLEPAPASRAYWEQEFDSKASSRSHFTAVLRQHSHHAAWRKFLLNQAHQRGFRLANEELFKGDIPILLLHFRQNN